MKKYKFINHTADLGIKVWGKTREDLFENAAYSMFDIMADLSKVEAKELIKVRIETQIGQENMEELLADWLRDLLSKFNIEEYLLKEFKIGKIDSQGLEAEVRGEKLDLSHHSLKREIKAVTYHELEVKKVPKGWEAQVIFDI